MDTCFNVECVLPGRNFYFFGGYLVVTARYLVVTARYLVVTARYRSLLLVPTFSMNGKSYILIVKNNDNWTFLVFFVFTIVFFYYCYLLLYFGTRD